MGPKSEGILNIYFGVLFSSLLKKVTTVDIVGHHHRKIFHVKFPNRFGSQIFVGYDLGGLYTVLIEGRHATNCGKIYRLVLFKQLLYKGLPVTFAYHPFEAEL